MTIMINNSIKPTDMDNILLAGVWDGVTINVDKQKVVIMYNQAKKDPENFKKRIMFILDRISNINITPEQLELVRREAKTLRKELEDDVNSSVLSGRIVEGIMSTLAQWVIKGLTIVVDATLGWDVCKPNIEEIININLSNSPLIVKILKSTYYSGINIALLVGLYFGSKLVWELLDESLDDYSDWEEPEEYEPYEDEGEDW